MAIDPEDKHTGNLFEHLQGKRFVVTGRLESLTREDVSRKIKFFGGKVSHTISKKTDYVVVGSNPGGNSVIAKEMGIKTITEDELLELMGYDPMPRFDF